MSLALYAAIQVHLTFIWEMGMKARFSKGMYLEIRTLEAHILIKAQAPNQNKTNDFGPNK